LSQSKDSNFLLKYSKSLYSINLSNSNSTFSNSSYESAKFLSSFLESNKYIRYIDLSSNEIDDITVQIIFQGLAKNIHLNELEIELFDNNITDKGAEYISQELYKKIDLKFKKCHFVISLWGNQITSLESLINLVIDKNIKRNNIFELNLQKNKIDESSGKIFFINEENLQAINFFDVRYNKIKSEGLSNISNNFTLNKIVFLEKLDFSYNQIKDEGLYHIANSLGKTLFAENMIFKENEITIEGVNYFCKMLTKVFKKQKKLSILKSQLEEGRVNKYDKNTNPFRENFSILETQINLVKLKTLDLSCNNISKGIIPIADFLGQNFEFTIENLNLSSCAIGPIELIYLGQCIKKHTYLRKLDLSNNFFTEDGLKEFLLEISEKNEEKNNFFFFDYFKRSFSQGYTDKNKNSPKFNLEELNLNHNKLNDNCAKYLSNFLIINKTLKKLSLTYSQFTDKGIEHLISSLKHNKTLSSLNLSDCPFFNLDILMKNLILADSTLEELYISHCDFDFIYDKNILLNDFLKSKKNKLKILDMSYNKLNDNTFCNIIQALIQNDEIVLDSLNLACNDITDYGIEKIINLFIKNNKVPVKEIKLNRNKITEYGVLMLVNIIREYTRFSKLEFPVFILKDNRISCSNPENSAFLVNINSICLNILL
jgi:Ran GTPase-activating protein (RanGAP) involved in mRNA processing and transport